MGRTYSRQRFMSLTEEVVSRKRGGPGDLEVDRTVRDDPTN